MALLKKAERITKKGLSVNIDTRIRSRFFEYCTHLNRPPSDVFQELVKYAMDQDSEFKAAHGEVDQILIKRRGRKSVAQAVAEAV